MSAVDCREVEERLPWFVHGGLGEAERDEVERHLADCQRCRAALEATREASRLYAAHLPTEAIVDYALGLPVDGVSRSVLESHLAFCEECREEQQLVESERGAPLALPTVAHLSSAVRRPPLRRSRALALAASLAAVSALAVWFAMRPGAPLPEARVAFVELLPESSRTRSSESRAVTLDRGRTTALLLVTDRAELFEEVRVRLFAQPGARLLWRETGLLPAAEGAYAVVLPAGAFAPGGVELVLEGRATSEGSGDWSEIARYRVALGP